MSLSSTTLSAIQQAGAAVYAADAELKKAVNDYAGRVHAAMGSNPYGLGNDAMFENWKIIARLSQTMAGVEEELKKVYLIASDLLVDDQPLLVQASALAAPERPIDQMTLNQSDMAPTDVVAKRRKKVIASPDIGKSARTGKSAGSGAVKSALPGNAARLLAHFKQVLNTRTLTVISQTAVAKSIGIPLGSMTSAIKKLIDSQLIVLGPNGSIRLTR